MNIIWAPLAVDRLNCIFDFISEDNVIAANDLIESIFKKVESLSENAERGRIVPESNRKDIREIFEQEYRIIYKIEINRIVILTIRNFKQLLPKEDIS